MSDTLTDLDASRACWPRASRRGAGASTGRGPRPRGPGAVGGGALHGPDRGTGRRRARAGWATCWSTPAARARPGVQDFCLGEIALARGTGVTATEQRAGRRPRPAAPTPAAPGPSCGPGRPRSTSPAGSPSCPGTCPPTGSASSTPRSRGSSPTRPAAGSSRSPRRRSSRPTPPSTTSASRPRRARRYVGLGRTDEFGLRTVIARVEAGDAVWVEATVAPGRRDPLPHPPRHRRRRAAGHRLRLPRPARRAPPAPASSTPTPRTRRARPRDVTDGPEPGDRVPGRPPRRPPRPPTCRRSRPGPSSTSTSTRPHSPAPTPWPGSRASARSPLSALCGLLGRHEADRAAGARPLLAGALDRLRAPRVAQGADLPHAPAATTGPTPPPPAAASTTTTRPPTTTPGHPTRAPADRLPQLGPPGPATPPLEDARRLPLPPVRRRDATSG